MIFQLKIFVEQSPSLKQTKTFVLSRFCSSFLSFFVSPSPHHSGHTDGLKEKH